MKLLSFLPLAFFKAIFANPDEMQVVMEVQGAVGTSVQTRIAILTKLNKKYDTSEDYGCKEILAVITEVTGNGFSAAVYDKCGVDEEDRVYKEISTDDDGNEISPRFGGSTATMASRDPSNYLGGYGCWCKFSPGKANPKGRGAARDNLDKLCKNLQLSYECLRMDIWEAEERWCHPETQAYNYDLTNFIMLTANLPSTTITNICESANPNDQCASKTCILELNLIYDYSVGIQDVTKIKLDQSLVHAQFDQNTGLPTPQSGTFDPSVECAAIPQVINPGSGDPNAVDNTPGNTNDVVQKACCGTFPNRYPYNTLSEHRGCCNGVTYYKAFKQCCDDSYLDTQC